MSCNNPFYLPHKDLRGRTVKGIFDQIPCGWCMGCKIDRRNMWEDRINWAKRGMSSAFVTLTYDDYKLPVNNEGTPTLRRDDFKKFIDRLRVNVARKRPSQLCTKNFKYYAVGEYGDTFGRPHYHVIFAGLDFYDMRKMFYDTWKGGIIDSLPVLEGAVRYVLKYLDKQVHGDLVKEIYDDNEIERPFRKRKQGTG